MDDVVNVVRGLLLLLLLAMKVMMMRRRMQEEKGRRKKRRVLQEKKKKISTLLEKQDTWKKEWNPMLFVNIPRVESLVAAFAEVDPVRPLLVVDIVVDIDVVVGGGGLNRVGQWAEQKPSYSYTFHPLDPDSVADVAVAAVAAVVDKREVVHVVLELLTLSSLARLPWIGYTSLDHRPPRT